MGRQISFGSIVKEHRPIRVNARSKRFTCMTHPTGAISITSSIETRGLIKKPSFFEKLGFFLTRHQ